MRLTIVSVLLIAGCSSVRSASDVCAQLAAAQCDKLDACVQGGTALRYGDHATCLTRLQASCVVGLGAADTGNDPAHVVACAVAVPTASCDDFLENDVASCAPVTGARALGAPCAFAAQCQSSVCAIAKGTNCGTCASAKNPGDSCAMTSCSRGLTCVAATDACQPFGAAGASCDDGHPCGYHLSCVTPSGMSTGSCEPSGTTVGAACDPRRQDAPACDTSSALSCDRTTKQCVAATYAGPGGSCGQVGGVTVSCDQASKCFGAMGMTPGTCKAIALEGQACDTAAGPSCMTPARCVTGSASATSGTCRLPDPGVCG